MLHPLVRDLLVEFFDVCIHNPGGSIWIRNYSVNNGFNIFKTSIRTESIRMLVPSALSNRFQSQLPLRLVPAIKHAWDSSKVLTTTGFPDIYTYHGLTFIVFTYKQLLNCFEFFLWSIPYDTIDSWCLTVPVGSYFKYYQCTGIPGADKVLLLLHYLAELVVFPWPP